MKRAKTAWRSICSCSTITRAMRLKTVRGGNRRHDTSRDLERIADRYVRPRRAETAVPHASLAQWSRL